MKTLKGTLVLVLALLGSSAFAHHYGMAGCGLGSLAFGDQPGKIQIVAATVNDLVSPQTFALSSGTSGCYEDSADVAANKYIDANKVALQKEISQGRGESINGLIAIWGCQMDSSVGQALQSNYQQIYSKDLNSSQLNQAMKNVIKSNSTAAPHCPALI